MKFLNIVLWFLLFISLIAGLIFVGWILVNIDTAPLWLGICAVSYIILFTIYFKLYKNLSEKKMRALGINRKLEIIYKKVQRMSENEKKDYSMSEDAKNYFIMIEQGKEVLTLDELSKYKKVLFGTEDPYIVTEEGKIIVKACPGDIEE